MGRRSAGMEARAPRRRAWKRVAGAEPPAPRVGRAPSPDALILFLPLALAHVYSTAHVVATTTDAGAICPGAGRASCAARTLERTGRHFARSVHPREGWSPTEGRAPKPRTAPTGASTAVRGVKAAREHGRERGARARAWIGAHSLFEPVCNYRARVVVVMRSRPSTASPSCPAFAPALGEPGASLLLQAQCTAMNQHGPHSLFRNDYALAQAHHSLSRDERNMTLADIFKPLCDNPPKRQHVVEVSNGRHDCRMEGNRGSPSMLDAHGSTVGSESQSSDSQTRR